MVVFNLGNLRVVGKSVFVAAVSGSLTALVDAATSSDSVDFKHFGRAAAIGAVVGVSAYLKSSPLKPPVPVEKEEKN